MKLKLRFLVVVLVTVQVYGTCQPPPTGLWLMQTFEPPNTFRIAALSGYVYLERDKNNNEVFIGAPTSHPRYLSTSITFIGELTALFDTETCSLFGGIQYRRTHVHDTFHWKYKGGGIMAGLYRPMWFGVPQFQQWCLMTLQYQGPRPDLKGKINPN